jgi:hypothetical protein
MKGHDQEEFSSWVASARATQEVPPNHRRTHVVALGVEDRCGRVEPNLT